MSVAHVGVVREADLVGGFPPDCNPLVHLDFDDERVLRSLYHVQHQTQPLDLLDQKGVASHLDQHAQLQLLHLHELDEGARGAPDVPDHEHPVLVHDLGVVPRNGLVEDQDLVGGVPADVGALHAHPVDDVLVLDLLLLDHQFDLVFVLYGLLLVHLLVVVLGLGDGRGLLVLDGLLLDLERGVALETLRGLPVDELLVLLDPEVNPLVRSKVQDMSFLTVMLDLMSI